MAATKFKNQNLKNPQPTKKKSKLDGLNSSSDLETNKSNNKSKEKKILQTSVSSLSKEKRKSDPTKDKINSELSHRIQELQQSFFLTFEQLREIRDAFKKEFELGLKNNNTDLAMLPSFITKRPTGVEKGVYYAIDFGGSNVRMCRVTLKGNKQETQLEMDKYSIPEQIKIGNIELITAFIAEKLMDFIKKHETNLSQQIHLGFTFSFPLDQKSANKGLVLKWNKGFDYEDSIGSDIVELLQISFKKLKLNIKINAVINDTVGTLLSSAYTKPNTLAGVILGTGTNACYYEKIENIEKLTTENKSNIPTNHKEMIINTEWGNFDPQGKIIKKTEFDHLLDSKTSNAKSFTFEKMVSGRYLGEIVRLIINSLRKEKLLFGKKPIESKVLDFPYMLNGSYLKRIEDDYSPDLIETRKILEQDFELQSLHITFQDCKSVKDICKLVSFRSARLSAAAIASICQQRLEVLESSSLEKKLISIGVDGSLYNLHSEYRTLLINTFNEIIGSKYSDFVEIISSNEGSSIGAALAAMVQQLE